MNTTHYDAEKKLWRGNDSPSLFNPEISVGQALLKALEVHGSKIAQVKPLNQRKAIVI